MGARPPDGPQLRFSLDGRYHTERAGELGVDRLEIEERRLDLGAAWALNDRALVAVMAPLIQREVRFANLSQAQSQAVGDVEALVRVVAWRDRPFAPTHTVALTGGLRLPTSPVVRDAQGAPLSFAAQPGQGAWTPTLGAAWMLASAPWALFTNAQVYLPGRGHQGAQGGRALNATVAAQHQPFETLAFQLGVDARWEARASLDGAVDPSSGGAVAFVAPGAIWSPMPTLQIYAIPRVPVFNALNGAQDEGFSVSLGVAWSADLGPAASPSPADRIASRPRATSLRRPL